LFVVYRFFGKRSLLLLSSTNESDTFIAYCCTRVDHRNQNSGLRRHSTRIVKYTSVVSRNRNDRLSNNCSSSCRVVSPYPYLVRVRTCIKTYTRYQQQQKPPSFLTIVSLRAYITRILTAEICRNNMRARARARAEGKREPIKTGKIKRKNNDK